MRMTMRLTFDGLVSALRQEAHRLAEEVEDKRPASPLRPLAPGARADAARPPVENDDVGTGS